MKITKRNAEQVVVYEYVLVLSQHEISTIEFALRDYKGGTNRNTTFGNEAERLYDELKKPRFING